MRGQDRQEADFIPTLIYSFGRFKYSQNHFSLDKISSTTFLSYTFYREEKATQFTSSMAVVQFCCWCADVQMCSERSGTEGNASPAETTLLSASGGGGGGCRKVKVLPS